MKRIRQPTPATLTLFGVIILVAFRLTNSQTSVPTRCSAVAHVQHVIDGDTFRLPNGESVRLLGIDSPEVAHHDQKAERWGAESTQWLTSLIEGGSVTLETEIDEPRDRYDRILAWVYLADGRLVNELSLRAGHAKLLDRYGLPPDLETQLRQAEADARQNGRGLWGTKILTRRSKEAGTD